MSLLSIDEHLNSFRQRTKVCGNTFLEKLEQFLTRLKKVGDDCDSSSDKSHYRWNFGKTHSLELINIQSIIKENPEEDNLKIALTEYMNYLNSHFSDLHKVYLAHQGWEWEIAGKVDALCYILVELELVVQ